MHRRLSSESRPAGRTVSLLLAALCILTVAACGNETGDDDTGSTGPTTGSDSGGTGDTTGGTGAEADTSTTDSGSDTGTGADTSTETTGETGSADTDTDTETDTDTSTDGETTGVVLPLCEDPEAGDAAVQRPGTLPDGTVVVADGRQLTPAGDQLVVGLFPMSMIVSPDGKFVVVANSGNGPHSLTVVDAATWKQVSDTPVSALYIGLAFDKQGRLYAAGGQSSKVYRYTLSAAGELALDREYAVADFPTGLYMNAAGTHFYVTQNYVRGTGFLTKQSTQIARVDIETGTLEEIEVGANFPYGVYATDDETKLVVSKWGPASKRGPSRVRVLDRAGGKFTDIRVGENPGQVLPSKDGTRAYVVSTDAARIEIIDIAGAKLADSIVLSTRESYDIGPNAMALSADEKRLYVTSTSRNSIEVIDLATKTIVGSIPVGLYPIDVRLSADGKTLYWLAAKGNGSGPNLVLGTNINSYIRGVVGKVAVPTDAELGGLTAKVDANIARRSTWIAGCRPQGPVLPTAPGAESPIKHIVFVMKENLTYDSVLSDLDFGERDPSLLRYGEPLTPNLHKLAREYVNLDNFFTESETSVQGHTWTVIGVSNDFSEKTWTPDYRNGARTTQTGVEDATFPEDGMYGDHVLDGGKELASYGQIVGTGSPEVARRISPAFGFYNNGRSDVDKVQVLLKDIAEDKFPEYVYVALPNDHTIGRSQGAWTEEWMIADNDLALGVLVEGIAKSKYWDSTLIVVTEDDPQGGSDHVDAHRVPALVISPWSKRGYNSSVHYSFASFFRTTDLILGLPPFNIYDEIAVPFYDVWAETPDNTAYTAVEPAIWRVPQCYDFNAAMVNGGAQSDPLWPDSNPDLANQLDEARELDRMHGTSASVACEPGTQWVPPIVSTLPAHAVAP
jgi:YVTN family beta-propeller protein